MPDPFRLWILKVEEDHYHLIRQYADGSEEMSEECYSTVEDCIDAIEQDYEEARLH